jgi:hypothetical protein
MRMRQFTGVSAVLALTGQSIAPVAAQMTTMPVPDRPQIQPPRPNPGRPEIQPPRPNPGWGNDNRGYAGRIRCEARSNSTKRCAVRTDNRVVLLTRHGGTCTQGRNWGFTRSNIWVAGKCRATFAYGYGNDHGDGWGGNRPRPPVEHDKDKGPSTGLIIGGVAVAAGLVALLASKNKKKEAAAPEATVPETPTTYPPGPPAAVSADLAMLPVDARPSMQTCLFEASRQIGVTGGTRLRLDKLVNIEPGNGGWRFRTEMTATYPDGDRSLPMFCRATPTKVVQLDFAS